MGLIGMKCTIEIREESVQEHAANDNVDTDKSNNKSLSYFQQVLQDLSR